jgi:hypothetical protein
MWFALSLLAPSSMWLLLMTWRWFDLIWRLPFFTVTFIKKFTCTIRMYTFIIIFPQTFVIFFSPYLWVLQFLALMQSPVDPYVYIAYQDSHFTLQSPQREALCITISEQWRILNLLTTLLNKDYVAYGCKKHLFGLIMDSLPSSTQSTYAYTPDGHKPTSFNPYQSLTSLIWDFFGILRQLQI